jgi:parvulin-like peptidyl-prolyl isomerase
VKLKRNGNIKNIGLTLIALLASTLLGATADASAEPANQGIAKPAAVSEPAAPDSKAQKSKGLPYYAKVGNAKLGTTYVTWIDYNYEYSSEASKKFYHGKPSEATVAAFQRQIGDTLVTNAMLVQEAKRRKLKPDAEFIKQELDKYEQRFANDPKWPEARPRVLPIITARLQNENLRGKLEKLVRNVPSPSVKQLKKYYADHPEKFTAPAQPRVAVLLLRVDPGAPDADWQKASEQGRDLVKRLRAGEDFAELARQYSGDSSAEAGGDMGYLHEGMLPELPSETVSKLQPGEISDPVNLMEGVGIFRLIERKPAEIRSFKAVQARAKELWLNEQSDNAWNSLIARLKKNTPVQVDESRFLPLPVASGQPDESAETSKPAETVKP